jgi:epsilon-lactone hydrolase
MSAGAGSVTVDKDGTAHIVQRSVPVPGTISAEAKAYLATSPFDGMPPLGPEDPFWILRPQLDAMMQTLGDYAIGAYGTGVEKTEIGGVPVAIVSPAGELRSSAKILVNLHGGAFVTGQGSVIEAVPVAAAMGLKVIAVDYRLAPEHPYPAALDDAVAVYKALLETHKPEDIVLYGSSAGGILTGQAIVRFRKEGLPLPCCVGIFTGAGDLTDLGDSVNIFNLMGFWGNKVLPTDHPASEVRAFLAGHDPADPAVSPMRGDLSFFPPSLMLSGTRDSLLSATSSFHRALRRAGAESDLFVFDAMPHAHWYAFHMPESQEAVAIMAAFFGKHLRL